MAWRYVVLRHEGIADPHYDLMLETSANGPLRTWRTSQWPPEKSAEFTKLADHRRSYLEYEGPISGARGSVRRIEGGTYEDELIASGAIRLSLHANGTILRLILRRVNEVQWKADEALKENGSNGHQSISLES